MVSARGGGADTDQVQVHLTPLRGLCDQSVQQGFEDACVTPLPEAVVDGRPGAELGRHLPPLPARLEPPDHALELLSQLLGVRAIFADRPVYGSTNAHWLSVSCTHVTQEDLTWPREPPPTENAPPGS